MITCSGRLQGGGLVTELTPSQAFKNHIELRLMLIKWVSELEDYQLWAVSDVVEMLHNNELNIDDEEAVYTEYIRRCEVYDIEENTS